MHQFDTAKSMIEKQKEQAGSRLLALYKDQTEQKKYSSHCIEYSHVNTCMDFDDHSNKIDERK